MEIVELFKSIHGVGVVFILMIVSLCSFPHVVKCY